MAVGNRPADDVAATYFRQHRYIGSKDRAQVSRHVYSVLRHRAALDWWVDRAGRSNIAASPRSRMMAALLVAEGEPAGEIVGSFDGGRFRPAALSALAAFKDGLIEVQDEGSQLAALLLGAGPGMRVVDFCAGAGGKTLALAAAMKNRGKLVACDTAGWRLDRSGQRLRRAGASNVERRALSSERDLWVKHHAKGFDRVLVDAPCLGIGSWRRNPDAKWRATPTDLAELQIRQHDILRLTRAQHGTDGFFVALFERKAAAIEAGKSEDSVPVPTCSLREPPSP